jgi:predicted MFS family arabinose efflux permease
MTLFDSLSPALMRLIAGQICLHAAMAGLRLAGPLWALKNGQSPAAAGVLVALFALSSIFVALPAGRYADRHGLKRPFGLCVAIAISGALLPVVFPHFLTLSVAALLMGGATSAAVISLQRHVGRSAHSPLELKQAFSWLSIGPAAANFVGPFLAGVLIDLAGYRAAFAFCALLPVLAWTLVRQTQEEPLLHAAKQDAGHVKTRRAWDLLRDEGFRRLLLVNWFMSTCWDAHAFLVPVMGHERGYSASVIGTIFGAFAIAAAAVRVLLPVLAHSLREWAVITVAMVMTAMLFVVYPLMPTALSMGVVSVFLGFTLGCVQPMVMSTLHQITPVERHGEALGLRMMTINASSVAMPILLGAVGAAVGTAALFWAIAAMVGAGSYQGTKLKD